MLGAEDAVSNTTVDMSLSSARVRYGLALDDNSEMSHAALTTDLNGANQPMEGTTMAHVTHFRIKAKPGEREAVLALFDKWQAERKPTATGFVRSMIASNLDDPDELMASVMFDTKEQYDANSSTPEQGAWYQELRSHLVADPDWFNGKVERDLSD